MGVFAAYFWKKWTFLSAFLEKVDFFGCSPHVGGMFRRKILKNMIENCAFRDIMETLWPNYIPFQIVSNKICPKFSTIWDIVFKYGTVDKLE